MDSNKYGGYRGAGTSYFAQIEFDNKKGKRVKNIIGVPIYVASQLKHNPKAFEDYCKEVKGLKNVEIIVPKIKKNTLMEINGFPMRIRGEDERNLQFKGAIQPFYQKEKRNKLPCSQMFGYMGVYLRKGDKNVYLQQNIQ